MEVSYLGVPYCVGDILLYNTVCSELVKLLVLHVFKCDLSFGFDMAEQKLLTELRL